MQEYFITYSPDKSGFSYLGRPYPRQTWSTYFWEQWAKKKERAQDHVLRYSVWYPAKDEADLNANEEEEEPPKVPMRQPRKPVPMETLFDTIYIGVLTRLNIVAQIDNSSAIGISRYLCMSFTFMWYWWLSLWYIDMFFNEGFYNRLWSFLNMVGISFLTLNIGPCMPGASGDVGYSPFCYHFAVIYACMRGLMALLYLFSLFYMPTRRLTLYCLWLCFYHSVSSIIFGVLSEVDDQGPAVDSLFPIFMVWDVGAFLVPNFFEFYRASIIPYDVEHVLDRFTRIITINLGQIIIASFAVSSYSTEPDADGYARAVAVLLIVTCLRNLYLDAYTYDRKKMEGLAGKSGHALRKGFIRGCLFVIAFIALCMSISMTGSTLQFYVSEGILLTHNLTFALSAALFIMCFIKVLHAHKKPALLRKPPLDPDEKPQADTPVIFLSNRWYLRVCQHFIYLLARKSTKVLIRFIPILMLVPIGAAINNDTIVISLFCCILPLAVLLDWLGNSTGIASLVQRIGQIGRPKEEQEPDLTKKEGPQRPGSWLLRALSSKVASVRQRVRPSEDKNSLELSARQVSTSSSLETPLLSDSDEDS